MRITFITAFTFILSSCHYFESPSKWTTAEDPEEFKPIVLNLDEFKLNNTSVILGKEDLISKFGQPDTITSGGGFWPEEIRKSKKYNDSTIIRYESWHYNQFKFAVWKNFAQLQFIDFRNNDIILKHSKISLSADTKLDEIKDMFRYAYDWRNYPLHRQFGSDPSMFGFDKSDLTWLDFSNGLDPFYRNIELTFHNGALIWIDFEIAEEKYWP